MAFWYRLCFKMGFQKWCHQLSFSSRIRTSRMDPFKEPLLHFASLWARFMSPVACFFVLFWLRMAFFFNYLNCFRNLFASIYDFAAGFATGNSDSHHLHMYRMDERQGVKLLFGAPTISATNQMSASNSIANRMIDCSRRMNWMFAWNAWEGGLFAVDDLWTTSPPFFHDISAHE